MALLEIKIGDVTMKASGNEEFAAGAHMELMRFLNWDARVPAGKAGWECKKDADVTGGEKGLCRLRRVCGGYIYPALLEWYRAAGLLDKLISPFDEIDIPIAPGGTVTAVCAYAAPKWARFVLKDCWDKAVMNDEAANDTGYSMSKGRGHVLEDILPNIDPAWRCIFKPRKMVEEIGGERVEYEDLMWLPSATDVFGPSEYGCWKDIDDSFQLSIFKRERDRVKECGDEGTYPWWLRSVYATSSHSFRLVYTDGRGTGNSASYSGGFAPGFDI